MRAVGFVLSVAAAMSAIAAPSCTHRPEDGVHRLEILTTGDVHGAWFDSSYVDGGQKNSLFAVKWYVDSVRSAVGADNVLLLDAGDCLQGDNAAYYYNYVDTASPHLYPRLAAYMGYDAVAVGNHDIETGHPVYDRIGRQLRSEGIPFLGGNAIRADGSGKPYFPTYKVFRRAGLKVAVLGFTNPNMRAWLSEELWSGMGFESLIPLVQEDVDMVRRKERPDVVVVVAHSGTGDGDGGIYESQGKDLLQSLKGVDVIVCAHDHRPCVIQGGTCLINGGSHCRNIGHGTVELKFRDGGQVSRTVSASLIPVDKSKASPEMREAFRKEFEAVREFTLQPIGELGCDMRTRDSYAGMCGYMNLLHAISLSCAPAQISFAAPLTYDGVVKAGTLIYNDLFTLYPYENQLFVLRMGGREVKDYMEHSYDIWTDTVSPGGDGTLLRIRPVDDPRYAQTKWSFKERPYNFDSAGGLVYEVDVTKDCGHRVSIVSLADGTPFHEDSTYNVAMTSYRASGGGGHLAAAGVVDGDARVTARYPEMRELIYRYLREHGTIDPAVTGDNGRIGSWRFVPGELAGKMLREDMRLLFGDGDGD